MAKATQRLYACSPRVVVLTLILISLASAADYTFHTGLNDSDYETAKHAQLGWLDAFGELGVIRNKYISSTPWLWYENSFIESYRTYSIPQFDSSEWGTDYSTLTVSFCHSGTFRDAWTNAFYFLMETKDPWEGVNHITSDMVRLGESRGCLRDDDYPGYCRYVMALGCNAVAVGPAMSDDGNPTYSRPDLFNQNNSNHANPFKIWGPVMTDGVRLVMGHTDYTYGNGPGDRAKYSRFASLIKSGGYSIAGAFAQASLDAFWWQKPVVLAQGATKDECESIIREQSFSSARPDGNDVKMLYYWCENRVRDLDGPYVWSRSPDSGQGSNQAQMPGSEETPVLPETLSIYDSKDSQEQQNAALLKYREVFGIAKDRTPQGKMNKGLTIWKTDESRTVVVDPRTGSLHFRDIEADRECIGPCKLTEDQCAERAVSLLVAHGIVASEELSVDRIISVNRMTATEEEIATNIYMSGPQVIRYIVVLKRNMGELPILTNDTDTITVEFGSAGRLVSLSSEYSYGRTFVSRTPVVPCFRRVDEATSALALPGTVRDLRAGLMPLEDGSYVPVYEVVATGDASGLASQLTVDYYRVDTLEPVTPPQDGEGHELDDEAVQQSVN